MNPVGLGLALNYHMRLCFTRTCFCFDIVIHSSRVVSIVYTSSMSDYHGGNEYRMHGGVMLIVTPCHGARDGVPYLSELSWGMCSVVVTYFQLY